MDLGTFIVHAQTVTKVCEYAINDGRGTSQL